MIEHVELGAEGEVLPSSPERMPLPTAPAIEERIRRQIEANVRLYVCASREQIDKRLEELDREWDIERLIETNAASLALAGIVFGAAVSKRWLLLSGAVAAFLLQHGLQGWCPPVPIFRRLGFRSVAEIDYERYALKVLRGDFDHLVDRTAPGLEAARR